MKVVGGAEFADDVITTGKSASTVIGSRVMESW
jgi:hypothetical protein